MPLLILLPNLGMGGTEAAVVIIPSPWVTTQAVSDGWVDLSSASADIAVWGEVWGASWGTSTPWKTVNNITNSWVKVQ